MLLPETHPMTAVKDFFLSKGAGCQITVLLMFSRMLSVCVPMIACFNQMIGSKDISCYRTRCFIQKQACCGAELCPLKILYETSLHLSTIP